MTLFMKSLLKSARLAQEDPTASTDEVTTTSEEVVLPPPEAGPSISPVILYSWLGAHLALGFLGWKAYDYDVTKTLDDIYLITKALAESFYGSLTREDFDSSLEVGNYFDAPHIKGWANSRLGGYVSAFLSIAGTATTFVAPGIFQYVTFGTTLSSAFVLAQALTASGWYDEKIDPTDPDMDTLEEVDPKFGKARNYLLLGGLLGFATDVAVLVTLFTGGPADAPEPEPEAPTEEEAATVELGLW